MKIVVMSPQRFKIEIVDVDDCLIDDWADADAIEKFLKERDLLPGGSFWMSSPVCYVNVRKWAYRTGDEGEMEPEFMEMSDSMI